MNWTLKGTASKICNLEQQATKASAPVHSGSKVREYILYNISQHISQQGMVCPKMIQFFFRNGTKYSPYDLCDTFNVQSYVQTDSLSLLLLLKMLLILIQLYSVTHSKKAIMKPRP